MSARFPLLLLTALVVGCATPPGPATPTPHDAAPAPEPPLFLGGCYEYSGRFPAPTAPLPPGFEPVPHAGGDATWATFTFSCRVENGTGPEAAGGTLREHFDGLLVTPPAALARQGAAHVVVQRAVAEDAKTVALLAQRGFSEAAVGTVRPGYNSQGQHDHQGGWSVTVRSAADSLYMVAGEAQASQPAPLRLFAVSQGRVVGWLDVTTTGVCLQAGAADHYAGDSILPTSDPASVVAGEGEHWWGRAMGQALAYTSLGGPPNEAVPEGPGIHDASACVA